MKTELVFSGDDVLVQQFPDEVSIVYPNHPLEPLKDFNKSLELALDNPLGMPKLQQLVDATSKVVIAFDDVSVPLPLTKAPDPRALTINVVLSRLIKVGIKKENIHIICATGLHRKCTPKELKALLGKKTIKEFKGQIFNHDPTDTIRLATLTSGIVVDVNKIVSKSNLIIYISIPFTPMNGGYKSVAVGLGSVESILQHHIPEVLGKSWLMSPTNSEMHKMINQIGKEIEKHVPIFQIEIPMNNDFFSSIYKWLWRPVHGKISFLRKLALKLSVKAPTKVKSLVRNRYRANYQPIGVFCGKVNVVHEKVLALIKKQMMITIPEDYDVLLVGIPNMTPYNIGTDPNPLLIHTLLHGYLANAYYNESPLNTNNKIIIGINPVRYFFDKRQHLSYQLLFEQLQPEKEPTRLRKLEKPTILV